MRTLQCILILALLSLSGANAFSQSVGDFISVASGGWNNPATWQTWTGSTWVAGGSTPGATSNVYLDNGPLVTLTQDEWCNDLHMRCTPAGDKLSTGSFTLRVNGKLRAFTGTPPGTSSTSPASSSTWINTIGGGKLSIVGNSRVVAKTGEWGANPPNWTLEIAMNSGQTATFNTNFKAGDITVASGTLSIPSNDLRADKTTTGSGSITVNSGATLALGSGTLARTGTASTGYFALLTVNGNLSFSTTSVGSINANSIAFNGTVQYSANGAQTLVQKTAGGGGSATPNTYTNLTVSGSGLKRLAVPTTVSGNLTFGGTASLALGTNNLTLSGTVLGAGPGTAIATTSTGNVVRTIATGASFVLPLSTDGVDYDPLTILLSPSDPPETFSSRIAVGVNPSAPYNGAAVQRTWTVGEGTPGGNNATLTFQWAGSQEGATFSRATADVWLYNGSSWVSVGASTSSGSDPYTLSLSGIQAFSPFIVGNHGELPITLNSFFGSAQATGGVALHWSTVSEINNYGFYVERATQSEGPYQAVSQIIPGCGTTNVPQQYHFVDRTSGTGMIWYRLKQIDLDQSVHFSDPISVQGGFLSTEQAPRVFELSQNYPNPFNPSTEIRFTVEKAGRASLKLYNTIGQEIRALFDGDAEPGQYYRVFLDGSALASGIYFYRLQSEGISQLKTLVLVK